jgi:hypothetical protein
MVFQLSKEEVLKVCKECSNYNESSDSCVSKNEPPRTLNTMRRCQKWDDHFGGKCLFRG